MEGQAPHVYMQGNSQKLPPQPKPFKRARPITAKEILPKKEEKQSFFGKLFGGTKSPEKENKNEDYQSSAPEPENQTPFALPRKPTESDTNGKRHEELIQAVESIRKALADSQARKVEVSLAESVPPMPIENLEALTKTQGQVSGALEKVAGQLDEAGKREGKMIDSLSKLDGSLGELTRFSEKSISTMDGTKGLLAKAHGSMDAMQNELKNSAKRYEELCEKIQLAEKENKEAIAKLQKRTVLVMGLLGLALIVSLIVAIAK